MANQTPELLDSKKVFAGRLINVTVDTVREADKTYTREVVHHRGSAVILPAFDDGTIALVRQYRHPAVRYLLELPAGTLDDQESPEAGAARELEEELGLIAGKLNYILNSISAYRSAQASNPQVASDIFFVKALKGDLGNKDAVAAALKKADFTSLRGGFKFNTNGYPIQNFYLTKVAKRPDGKFQTEIAEKVFENYGDRYAKECTPGN